MNPKPYERLAALAARELAAAQAGAVEELAELQAERAALLATLPPAPPPTARAMLERAAELQAEVTAVLAEGMARTGSELARMERGRGALGAYRPPVAASVRALDATG
jgi:Flagellar protein FliT